MHWFSFINLHHSTGRTTIISLSIGVQPAYNVKNQQVITVSNPSNCTAGSASVQAITELSQVGRGMIISRVQAHLKIYESWFWITICTLKMIFMPFIICAVYCLCSVYNFIIKDFINVINVKQTVFLLFFKFMSSLFYTSLNTAHYSAWSHASHCILTNYGPKILICRIHSNIT